MREYWIKLCDENITETLLSLFFLALIFIRSFWYNNTYLIIVNRRQIMKFYNSLLKKYPIRTKAITSGTLFSLGDALTQLSNASSTQSSRRNSLIGSVTSTSSPWKIDLSRVITHSFEPFNHAVSHESTLVNFDKVQMTSYSLPCGEVTANNWSFCTG